MKDSTADLQQAFRQLRLVESSQELPLLLRRAEAASWTYREFIRGIVAYKLGKREEKSIAKRLVWARFPYQKTLTDFHIEEQTSLSRRQVEQLKELNWLEQQYNLILLGPTRRSKTHLAIGMGMEAIQRGHQVMFLPMGELITILKTSEFTRKSQVQLNRIRTSDLVIIDDLM